MPKAAYLDEAEAMARWMTQRESRGPGDIPNAWRRLEARYGVPYQVFWSLRYRKPKGLFHDLFLLLQAAYQAEKERQMRMLQHEIEVTKAKAGPAANYVREAEAVADEENGEG